MAWFEWSERRLNRKWQETRKLCEQGNRTLLCLSASPPAASTPLLLDSRIDQRSTAAPTGASFLPFSFLFSAVFKVQTVLRDCKLLALFWDLKHFIFQHLSCMACTLNIDVNTVKFQITDLSPIMHDKNNIQYLTCYSQRRSRDPAPQSSRLFLYWSASRQAAGCQPAVKRSVSQPEVENKRNLHKREEKKQNRKLEMRGGKKR